MKAFLSALCLTLLASVANATLKTDYGHYYASPDQTPCNDANFGRGIMGVSSRTNWGGAEPTIHSYVYNFDTELTAIAGLGAPTGTGGTRIPNNLCKLWIFPQFKTFTAGVNPCPTWLTDVNGNPGYAPTNSSTSITQIAAGAASVTNTNPIVITTSGPHGRTTGDSVFIDNVAGNTAANGTWTVTVKSSTTFSIPVAGNGTRQQSGNPTNWYGRVTFGPAFICKLWDTNVLNEWKLFIAAYGTHYDNYTDSNGNKNVEGFILQESAISSTGNYVDDASVGGDYTDTGWTNAIIGSMQQCSTSWPTSHCMAFLNQIQGGGAHAGLPDMQKVSAALSALPNNQGCYAGPDILFNDAGLVAGTYQALNSHTGCRADSAQNTTIVGTSVGAAECVGGTTPNCDAVFSFAVRGVFGNLPTSVPVQSPYGLCINSYILWNSSTAEQQRATPTIMKNPYGVGWYGQCQCGGGMP